jgi:(p)ppGpp synthase/HD superfamily hydrolase
MSDQGSEHATRLFAHACRFAADCHTSQKRKGGAGEPYINHLAEVAELVAEATGGRDPELVAAAYLHDAVEDTAVTHEDLVERFGRDVADLVAEVTDDKSLPKAERKRLQVEHAPGLSRRAKILKLADKTSNLRALADSPPADWTKQRRRDYISWGRDVVAGLRGACPWLEERFDEAAAAADRAVG